MTCIPDYFKLYGTSAFTPRITPIFLSRKRAVPKLYDWLCTHQMTFPSPYFRLRTRSHIVICLGSGARRPLCVSDCCTVHFPCYQFRSVTYAVLYSELSFHRRYNSKIERRITQEPYVLVHELSLHTGTQVRDFRSLPFGVGAVRALK